MSILQPRTQCQLCLEFSLKIHRENTKDRIPVNVSLHEYPPGKIRARTEGYLSRAVVGLFGDKGKTHLENTLVK